MNLSSESIYGDLNFKPRWYALKTRYRHEKKVDVRLQQKGFTCYLPLHTTYHNWSDRIKQITEPLFSCYIFVKIALEERIPVLQTNGVVQLVSFNNVPAPIPAKQIDSIRQILQDNISILKVDYLIEGQSVKVTRGPLKGIVGILTKIKDQSTLIISIDVLQQSIAVSIGVDSIEPVENVVAKTQLSSL